MSAIALIKRRLLTAIPVLAIVTIGTFFLLEAAPGDAVDAYLLSIGGGDAGLAQQLRTQWGLDDNIISRLGIYLWNIVRFDFGWSVAFRRPVLDVVLERMPVTLLLMSAALTLSFITGSLLGVFAGARPGSARDRILSAGSLALYAVPSFWLGLVLAVVFAVQLRWLPLAGIETLASGKQGLDRTLDIARHLVLPASALGLIYLALYLRLMRAGMAEVWREDYVLAARAKGLSHRRIVWRHVARNALLPLITMLGIQAASMLGGSVVIESVFAIPGLGRLAQEAVSNRDTPLLMGIILASAVFVILVTLIVDLVYVLLDPRIRTGQAEQ